MVFEEGPVERAEIESENGQGTISSQAGVEGEANIVSTGFPEAKAAQSRRCGDIKAQVVGSDTAGESGDAGFDSRDGDLRDEGRIGPNQDRADFSEDSDTCLRANSKGQRQVQSSTDGALHTD